MTRRFLGVMNSTATATPSPVSPESEAANSDFDVILAALLCALICVLGLVAVARCAWIRRISGSSAPQTQANKGLKKEILRTLPKVTFSGAEDAGKFFDCAICLAEFVAGDELRVLPKCGHGFHVGCIDTWLGSHSTCPSCRQILMVTRCKKCAEVPAADRVDGAENESTTVARREDQINRFLP